MSSPFQQGQIVWATVPDPRGANAKSRPVVIVTATGDIRPDGDVQVVAVTTLTGQAPFSETVELPSDPAGHPQTKLKKPCEAVCSWVVTVPVADLRDSGGTVPPEVLVEILAKVSRLA